MPYLTRKLSNIALARKCPGLWLILFFFLLVVCFINPHREMVIDDDWAYARTVHHLLETGQYRLDNWASANLIAQVYWGAALAKVFGYSLTVLRLSTLILLFFGLTAFYQMLRDFGSDDTEASLLTLAVLASPLVLLFGFSFMTDVQFLSWLMIAAWLYTRALRRQSYLLMALASMAAAAAIGTRQFGIALVIGLFATWLLLERQRLRQAPLYLVGSFLPALVGLWQLRFGLSHPTFYMRINLGSESEYLHHFSPFLVEVLWRPTVILQYLGLFLLPLVPLCCWLGRESWTARNRASADAASRGQHSNLLSQRSVWLLVAWILYIGAGVCYGYLERGLLMPSIPWNLHSLHRVAIPLTLLTAALAVVFGWLLSRRYLEGSYWRVLPRAEGLLVLTSLTLLGLQLLYVSFGDEYLLAFLPFHIFGLGQLSRGWPRWCKRLTVASCLTILGVSSLWIRGTFEKHEASWRAAEAVRSTGVAPKQIYGDWAWNCYYSAWEDWITECRGQKPTASISADFFDKYLPRRESYAVYHLADSLPAPSDEDSRVLGRYAYRDMLLRQRYVYTVRRGRVKGSR